MRSRPGAVPCCCRCVHLAGRVLAHVAAVCVRTLLSEWVTNHHRDTYASHLGHPDMMAYFAVAENESVGRVRYNMLEVRRWRRCYTVLPRRTGCALLSRLTRVKWLCCCAAMPQKMLQPCGPPPSKD